MCSNDILLFIMNINRFCLICSLIPFFLSTLTTSRIQIKVSFTSEILQLKSFLFTQVGDNESETFVCRLIDG